MDTSIGHIRHCVELLRLALMCRPDLTIEEKKGDACWSDWIWHKTQLSEMAGVTVLEWVAQWED